MKNQPDPEKKTDHNKDKADEPENLNISLTHPPHEEIIKQLNDAESKLNEQAEALLRAQAELENYKRRAQREIENALKYNSERCYRELLDAFDSIDHSIIAAHAENADLKAIQKGLELTGKILQNTLQKLSLAQIDPLGQPFDPSLHEAISTEENTDYPPNTVIRVLQKGYRLYERVIRPARVTVSKAKS